MPTSPPVIVPVATTRHVPRYLSVYQALPVGLVVGGVAVVFSRLLGIELGVSAFYLTYVVMIVLRLPKLSAAHLRAKADESDTPSYIIILVALATVVVSIATLVSLLDGGGSVDRLHMALGIISVVLGWLCIHTMLAFHYAYEYYGTDASSPPDEKGHRRHVGGLDFPGSDAPDALSFVYFSFVVAMTAQVSDVTVTSNPMRRLVLLHGILAFFFNTVILAVAVNVVVALAH